MGAETLNHLAIIMDGNGRWAEQKKRPRAHGHIKGARVAKEIITACVRRKIPHLTLYAFSTENWLRPPEEVGFLMRLLSRYLSRERENLHKQNIRFDVIGEIDKLPKQIQKEVHQCIETTKANTGLHLVFAISYGSRQEITRAIKKIASEIADNRLNKDSISEELLTNYLETAGTPDPDLIIRTSGEQRISNFLLWQSAYSEFSFMPTLWPDFKESDLDLAIADFRNRSRRFGKISSHHTEYEPEFSENLD